MTAKTSGKTTAPFGSVHDDGGGAVEQRLGLAILWSAHEPHRAGEVAMLGRGVTRFGRGAADGACFARQRPASRQETGPPEGPGISRQQLVLRPRTGALVVENVGRCPLLVNGEPVDKTVAVPGDTLLLRGQLLLLVVSRPIELPPWTSYPSEALGPFGEVDALGLIGESPATHHLREQIGFVARANGHVLVQGESGTGKELTARAVHALSVRSTGPLVARNAATFPDGLIDAELFGNVRNYPNPGMVERKGLIGEADGGTLFLDEIGELAPELQAHLLRVLDRDGEYQRLGEARMRRADLRLVGATHRGTSALRHDLLGRLTLRVEVPPLSARREDLPLFVRHLLERALRSSPELATRFEQDDSGMPRVDAALIEFLARRDYRGNLRELEALLWRAMQTSNGRRLALTEAVASLTMAPDTVPPPSGPHEGVAPPARGRVDPATLRQVVADHGGNLAEAARALGLSSRYVLYRLLRKHGIAPDDLRS